MDKIQYWNNVLMEFDPLTQKTRMVKAYTSSPSMVRKTKKKSTIKPTKITEEIVI